jgi:predicted PurR-regulated permease PerM
MLTKHSYYFWAAILLVFAILAILLFSRFLAPLIIGALLAALGTPLYKRILSVFENLVRRQARKEALAAFITVLTIIILIVIPLIFIIYFLSLEAFDLFVFARQEFALDDLIDSIESFLGKLNLKIEIASVLKNQLLPVFQNLGLYLSQQLGGFLSNAVNLVIGLFIIFVSSYYLLKDGRRLAAFIMKLSPLKTIDEIFIFNTFKNVGEALFYGNFLIALIEGVLFGLGFWFFGFGSPVLWGFVIALTALIPLLGASLVFIPATIYLFVESSWAPAAGFLIYSFIAVNICEQILKPKLISHKMNVHPLLVLLSILGGIKVFGILGIIYGPLIIAAFLGLLNIFLESREGGVLA